MQFVQEYSCLDSQLQLEIAEFLRDDSRPFEASMVYDSLKDEKKILVEKRSSVFKTFTDGELFKKCEKLVDLINQKNKYLDFLLVKNDVTFIKYSEGGFFKSHADYLSLTSNIIQEYTLLMCVDADCDGGETILHLNEHFSHASKASVTPLNILVFRKDIEHEGALIKRGYKNIMSLNLWAISKDCERIIVVDVSTETFLIPVSHVMDPKLPDNVLKSFVSFQDACDSKKRILNYTEKNYSADAFSIIHKLYSQFPIQISDCKKYKDILDYYGFRLEQILTKSIKEEYDVSHDGRAKEVLIQNFTNKSNDTTSKSKSKSKSTSKSTSTSTSTSKSKSASKSTSKSTKNIDKLRKLNKLIESDDLILSGSLTKHIEFLELVKEELLPYIPFRIIFAEGRLTYGGGMSDTDPVDLSMQPVYMDFTENDDIYFIQRLVTTRDPLSPTTVDLEESCENKDDIFTKLKDGDPFDIAIDAHHAELASDDNNILLVSEDHYGADKLIMNLEGSFKSLKASLSHVIYKITDVDVDFFNYGCFCKSGEPSDVIETTNQYIITSDNILRINNKQREILNEYLDKHFDDIQKTIVKKLNNIKFALPQKTVSYDHFFCNENVYGNFNFLMVYGFLKYT